MVYRFFIIFAVLSGSFFLQGMEEKTTENDQEILKDVNSLLKYRKELVGLKQKIEELSKSIESRKLIIQDKEKYKRRTKKSTRTGLKKYTYRTKKSNNCNS